MLLYAVIGDSQYFIIFNCTSNDSVVIADVHRMFVKQKTHYICTEAVKATL